MIEILVKEGDGLPLSVPKVTIVELMDQIIPGADKDIVTPLMKRIEKKYENIHLKTKVTKVEAPFTDPPRSPWKPSPERSRTGQNRA